MLNLQWLYSLMNLKSLTSHMKCMPFRAWKYTFTAPLLCVSSRRRGWTNAVRENPTATGGRPHCLLSLFCEWCSENQSAGWLLPFLWLWINILTCSDMGHLEFMMVNLLFGEHTRAFEEVKAQGTGDSHQDICTTAHNLPTCHFKCWKSDLKKNFQPTRQSHPV